MENLTKEQIAVKVTKKNARKILGILDMFGEVVSNEVRKYLEHAEYDMFIMYSDAIKIWFTSSESRVEIALSRARIIKPNQLRTILAKEHLKVGDVVVCKNKEVGVTDIFEVTDKLDEIVNYESRYSNEDGFKYESGVWDISHFQRYATEEEKALLEPRPQHKELEKGCWYKVPNWDGERFVDGKYAFCFNGDFNKNQYGFNASGKWSNELYGREETSKLCQKLTEPEVIQLLSEEAKRRGLVAGNSGIIDGQVRDFEGDYWMAGETFMLGALPLMNNGEWVGSYKYTVKEKVLLKTINIYSDGSFTIS